MNAEKAGWSRRYHAALLKYLKQGPRSRPLSAVKLGRQAATLGLETLDVARAHERAITRLASAGNGKEPLKRAERFFSETITPIEDTHRAALKIKRRVKKLSATLDRRTAELATSRQRLKLRIAQRKQAEEALGKSRQHQAVLLKESQRLQKHLRRLAHQIISAQEDGRKKVSLELQNEIAQTLVGINVRLLMLRSGAASSVSVLKKEVASTQKLVKDSETLMRRFTCETGIHYET